LLHNKFTTNSQQVRNESNALLQYIYNKPYNKSNESNKCSNFIGTKVCRCNWHIAGSLGWPFPMLKYKYIFQIKYTEAILSNSSRKLLWFEISKMLIAV